jgi:hypothetical protein
VALNRRGSAGGKSEVRHLLGDERMVNQAGQPRRMKKEDPVLDGYTYAYGGVTADCAVRPVDFPIGRRAEMHAGRRVGTGMFCRFRTGMLETVNRRPRLGSEE